MRIIINLALLFHLGISCTESHDSIEIKIVNNTSVVLTNPYIHSFVWDGNCPDCGSFQFEGDIEIGGESEFAQFNQFNSLCFYISAETSYGYGNDCFDSEFLTNGQYALYVFDRPARNYVERIN